jgi:lysyl-tRNA synthetase class 1
MLVLALIVSRSSLWSGFSGRMWRMNVTEKDWLDQLVEEIVAQKPEGEIVVSSGHSPSGIYHIGTLREIMTANAIAWALRRAGRQARHIDVVDDFDAFRKVPAGVPEEWRKYIGVPLPMVPDPFECHESYGAHYLTELNEGLAAIDCVPDEQLHGLEMYKAGLLTDQIGLALDKLDDVRRIITEVGRRQLDDAWAPVQFLDDEHNLRHWKFAGWDSGRRLVAWRDRDGNTGEIGIDSGRVKLDWRLDWPARWAKLGVGVEPFGRDHATKGGSYDTGAVLVREIFGGEPPIPVPYEFINTVGETKKMSKSSGNVLTPKQALEVMPAEILRYFVISARPGRTLSFDSGLGLYTLIDEFAKAQQGVPTGTMAYAKAAADEEMISTVPFNHLVSVYQAARGNAAVTKEILERTDYEAAVRDEWPVIERELAFVRNWLEKYAPEKVRFEVQETLPELDLIGDQKTFLAALADTIEAEKDLNGQGMHDAIYAASQVAGMKAGAAFVTLYRVILGQDSGPKAGWFLASLDQTWLIGRLQAAAE